jgi:hypothetical protein
MTDTIPARTVKGRDVLLDRNIELDTKLRTVLAQCDGKRDADQIKSRFGNIVDVDGALLALRGLGLIEDSAPSSAPVMAQRTTVLEAALGATASNRVAAAAAVTAAIAESAPPRVAPMVMAPAPVAPTVRAAPVFAEPVVATPVVVAPIPPVKVAPAPVAAPMSEAAGLDEVDDDPFAEWFPASMRKTKDQAA